VAHQLVGMRAQAVGLVGAKSRLDSQVTILDPTEFHNCIARADEGTLAAQHEKAVAHIPTYPNGRWLCRRHSVFLASE
jgi:hypothetical protein